MCKLYVAARVLQRVGHTLVVPTIVPAMVRQTVEHWPNASGRTGRQMHGECLDTSAGSIGRSLQFTSVCSLPSAKRGTEKTSEALSGECSHDFISKTGCTIGRFLVCLCVVLSACAALGALLAGAICVQSTGISTAREPGERLCERN